MRNVKNTCTGKRGCRLTIIPGDCKPNMVSMEMFSRRHDIQKILSSFNILVDKVKTSQTIKKVA